MATVELKGLGKSFGTVNVIQGVDLKVEEGEFVVLVGPSGCGKSTLLRMIAGLEPISRGELLIDGRAVNDVAARDRGIAMVFQSYALYPHMTSAENMAFSLRLAGESKEVQAEKVARASDVLGLSDLLGRYPRELSGGQRQRVAMGRALVREPSVFLFDEPLSNLDAKLRVKMRSELKELHQRLKTTTIYVTHDQIEAMTLADRIVVLKDGRIEQMGTPLELYDRPRNVFVGSFLGSPAMNFLGAEIRAGDPGFAILGDGDRIVIPSDLQSGDVRIGIRPEDFDVAQAPGPGSFKAQVAVVEPTGAQTEVLLRKQAEELTVTFPHRLSVRPGDMMHLTPKAGQVHVFDRSTEKRLG
ncbi:ABC transporter ATP-binding protein [Hoeflea ulvae]|uniref:Sn-glycerol-3-phosphate ABC transporter ATP-binding protein UgpC n=1 Tax=Hoeflea ulvae TaxID=2983764 RepID=A0ABT3YMB3_9HYPH|nr:sn-glycerol-3-phosphate ABC transporter ATP-binding protein UgpC [Hoeflea ulvae]MCY0096855.1 sn-glycerol-3-phosphate ABC transporter ATP-binding protein UgpC [Hoeflea ulvae]